MLVSIAVVVGGGQAAGQVVASLRQEGYAGRIVLIGADPLPPYQRPPLSKAYLAGELAQDRLQIRDRSFYLQAEVEMRTGVSVSAIRHADHTLQTSDGDVLGFDHLVLATGSRPRRLGVVGAEHPRLFYLRSIDDARAIRAHCRPAARLVLIGGGYLGLEVAAVARKLGMTVTVLEAASQLLARVTGPEIGAFYRELHRQNGVEVHCGVNVTRIEGGPDRPCVLTEEGGRFDADLVIAAVGAVPNVELARDAGLVCNNGIVVDELCRSSVPGIYAAGDCAERTSPIYDTPLRLESVPNAIDHARIIAATISGHAPPPWQVPWFWSDQYDVKLQTAGILRGHDQIVLRGHPAQRSFAAYYLRAGRLLAVDAVNRPTEFSLAKVWIANRTPISTARLANDFMTPQDITA